jgi:hypothetical protein
MRYLLLISLLCSLLACSSAYRKLPKINAEASCLANFKPVFSKVLYSTRIDVTGRHLSGILLIKTMPDSSTRLLFTNEFGFKFFDFAYAANGEFKVMYIIKQMNKKPVIKTLRKDFELLLMQHLNYSDAIVLKKDSNRYYGFPQKKGYYYYITDSTCTHLIRMERSSRRKPVVEALMLNYNEGVPDSISISHKVFEFNIGLKKLPQ